MELPNRNFFKQIFSGVLLTGIVLYFLYLMIPWVSNDLWNDEIYTLKKFTLVPIKTTLTDYHVPNNHVLYNIFDHFYLKVTGISNMRQAFEHVWVLRLPLLLLSMVLLLLQYKTGKIAGGKIAGLLAAGILACSIPYQNFCLQVRGYPFSAFFDLLVVYNCLMYSIYRRRSNLVGLFISSFAAFYTIPSNLYCLIGVIAYFGVEWLQKTIIKRRFDTGNFYPVLSVVSGIAIGLLCYLPMLKQVFTNDNVRGSAGLPPIHDSIKMVMSFYHEIIEGKEFLSIIFVVCAVLYFILPLPAQQTQTAKIWKLVLWQFITPMVMIIFRGEHPPDRVFVYLAAFIALLAGVTIAYVLDVIPNGKLRWAAVLLMLIYLAVGCGHERKVVSDLMNRNLKTEGRPQDLRMDYYLYTFHPLRVARFLQQSDSKEKIPVILKDSEPHDMPDYLRAFDIPNHPIDSVDYLLNSYKKVFVITVFPHQFDSAFATAHHCSVSEVTPPSYHHIMELEAR